MSLSEKKLGRALVKNGLITENQLIEAYDRQIVKQSSLKDAIIGLGYLSEDDILGAISGEFGFTYLPLQNYAIAQSLLDLIPEQKCRQHKLVPVSLSGKLLTVAISNPFDILALDDIAILTGCEVMPVMSKETEIEEAVRRYYGQKQMSLDQIMQDDKDVDIKRDDDQIDISEGSKSVQINEAPVIKLANHIIATAVQKRASDIHIEPREKHISIRYRVDGVLLNGEENLPKLLQPLLLSRFKIMAKMDIAERRLPQDGRIKIVFEGRPIDLRVSSLPITYGEKIVIRLLDRANLKVKLEDLGMEAAILENFKQCIELPYGLLLVTGPTGSGKTTTLYGALNYINKPDLNIVTVEEPVEYELANVNQVQVLTEAGLTFGKALRHILRQDPDVIMIGEIRDKETLDIAMKSALTGHLVLSTLHTNDAPSAISRLVDMGGEPYLIAASLHMVLAQRLLRRLCENCKETYEVTEDLFPYFDGIEPKPTHICKPVGCSQCLNTGMRGRVAAMELLRIDESLRELISISSSINTFKQKALELGMKTLRQSAFEKVAQGIVAIEEAISETV